MFAHLVHECWPKERDSGTNILRSFPFSKKFILFTKEFIDLLGYNCLHKYMCSLFSSLTG